MWFRRKSDQLLNEPRRLSTADYLCKLMEEQNSLLREMLHALGRQPATLKARPVQVSRIRTEQDVFRITPERIRQQEQAEAEKKTAPWRSGPGSAPTASTSGSTPNASAVPLEDSAPRPSAP